MKRSLAKAIAVLLIIVMTGSIAVSAMEITEKEKNNDFKKAQKLEMTDYMEITGNLSKETDEDWYLYTMPLSGNLIVGFSCEDELEKDPENAGDDYWVTEIYNLSMENLFSEEWSTGEEEITLNAGEYYIKVASGGLYSNQKYKLTLEVVEDNSGKDNWVSEEDKKSGYGVDIGEYYYSDIKNSKQKDTYNFEVKENGAVWIDFYHEIIDDPKVVFTAAIYNSKNEELAFIERKGNVTGTTASRRVGVAPGKYKLVIAVKNYSKESIYDHQYAFAVLFNNTEIWEVEVNDKKTQANLIDAYRDIHGSTGSKKDKDWYEFKAVGEGKIKLSFRNNKENGSKKYWKVTVYDSKLKKLTSSSFKGGTDLVQYTSDVAVKKGSYFICVEKGDANTVYAYSFMVEPDYSPNANATYDKSIKAPVVSTKVKGKTVTVKVKRKGTVSGIQLYVRAQGDEEYETYVATIETKKKKNVYSYKMNSLTPGAYEVRAEQINVKSGKKYYGKSSGYVSFEIEGTYEPVDPVITDAPTDPDTPTITDAPADPDTQTVTDTPKDPDTQTVTDTPKDPDTQTVTDTPKENNDKFWDKVTSYDAFEPGIYDADGNMFFSFIDYWNYYVAVAELDGVRYNYFAYPDDFKETVSSLNLRNDKNWLDKMESIYKLDLKDDAQYKEWLEKYYKDCVFIIPQVEVVGNLLERNPDKVKTIVFPKTALYLRKNISRQNGCLENVIIPNELYDAVKIFDTRSSFKDCPNLTQESYANIQKLKEKTPINDDDIIEDKFDFIRFFKGLDINSHYYDIPIRESQFIKLDHSNCMAYIKEITPNSNGTYDLKVDYTEIITLDKSDLWGKKVGDTVYSGNNVGVITDILYDEPDETYHKTKVEDDYYDVIVHFDTYEDIVYGYDGKGLTTYDFTSGEFGKNAKDVIIGFTLGAGGDNNLYYGWYDNVGDGYYIYYEDMKATGVELSMDSKTKASPALFSYDKFGDSLIIDGDEYYMRYTRQIEYSDEDRISVFGRGYITTEYDKNKKVFTDKVTKIFEIYTP